MLEVRAISCTLILTLVIALASSNTLLSVQRAWAHSVIAIGNSPFTVKINPNTGNVYVGNDDGTVSVISPSNKVIATIPIGGFPGEIAVNHNTGNVYVANRDDGTVSVISPSNKVIATIPVGGGDTEGGGDFADDG